MIPTMQKEQKEEGDEVADDLPPLEDAIDGDEVDAVSPKPAALASGADSSQKNVGESSASSKATPVFNYSDEDEDEGSTSAAAAASKSNSNASAPVAAQASPQTKKVQYNKCTDLEELD